MTITFGPKLGLMVNGTQGEEHYAELMALLRGVDALVQCVAVDHTLTAPPVAPVDGDCYIIAASATGLWSGHSDKVARYSSVLTAWEFYTPKPGWLAWSEALGAHLTYNAGAWVRLLPAVAAPPAGFFDVLGSAIISPSNIRLAQTDSFSTSGIARAEPKSAGKRYFEIQSPQFGSGGLDMVLGIASSDVFIGYNQAAHGESAYFEKCAYVTTSGSYGVHDSFVGFMNSYTLGATVGFAVDLDLLKVDMYLDGVLQYSNGDYAGTPTPTPIAMYPFVTFLNEPATCTIALNDADFVHAVPSGYVAWAAP